MTPYRPPRAFWQEVRRLHTELEPLSRPMPASTDEAESSDEIICTAWLTDKPFEFGVWERHSRSRRFMGRLLAYKLVLAEAAVVPQQPDTDSAIADNLFCNEYTYSTKVGRAIRRDYVHKAGDSLDQLRSTIKADEAIFGTERAELDSTDYDRIINELRRGASGEYRLDLGNVPDEP